MLAEHGEPDDAEHRVEGEGDGTAGRPERDADEQHGEGLTGDRHRPERRCHLSGDGGQRRTGDHKHDVEGKGAGEDAVGESRTTDGQSDAAHGAPRVKGMRGSLPRRTK